MYSTTFAHLSDRFFKGGTWPTAEVIAPLVDGDHIFCLLYREMYFRHLYASGRPTLEQRAESWDNYRELFGVILTSNLNMQASGRACLASSAGFCLARLCQRPAVGRAGGRTRALCSAPRAAARA